jgi:hypothetical protein
VYFYEKRYGRKEILGFNLSEHAGFCKGDSPLIGATAVACYARRSLETGGNAESSEGSSPANVLIDNVTGKPIALTASLNS